MDMSKRYGMCLYQKEKKEVLVLKELLQFLRTNNPGRSASFAYVEAGSSLLPGLSLWENLKLETGGADWSDFRRDLKTEWLPLVNLLKRPDLPVGEAQEWEKFSISLLKGVLGPSRHLLIDMNEDILSPFMIQAMKKACCLAAGEEKQITLASASSSLWLDCAHSLVTRRGYEFVTEELNEEILKLHWTA
jgi:hypothetical protein